MNMKKMKKFFTLSRRAEGFTLVELIVVIAILAILGGVAVPAYSGYIKKAHMAADQTMASDVAKALQLQYYSNPNQAVTTYVVITQQGAGTTNATVDAEGNITVSVGGPITMSATPGAAEEASAIFADKAMAAVFGENWKETVKLESGDWADWAANGIQDKLGEPADPANPDGPTLAEVVTNSSYMTGTTPDALLNNAAQVTNAAMTFLDKQYSNMDEVHYYNAIKGSFGMESDEFDAMCKDYGIEVTKDASGNSKFGNVSSTQLSNLMVVASASDLSKGNDSSTASGLVLQYATFAGAVNSPYATAETKAAYDNLLTQLNTAEEFSDITAAMDAFTKDEGYKAYCATAQGNDDVVAFMGIMDALDTAASGLSDKAGLVSNSNAFASGEVVGAFNSYIALAAAIAGGEIDADKVNDITSAGGVVIMLTVTSNGCVVGATPAEVLPW